MDRSQIYREWLYEYLEFRPADCPDVIGRKVDAIEKKRSKMVIFEHIY